MSLVNELSQEIQYYNNGRGIKGTINEFEMKVEDESVHSMMERFEDRSDCTGCERNYATNTITMYFEGATLTATKTDGFYIWKFSIEA